MINGLLHFDTTCPVCKSTIHIPFFRKLEAKAIEEYDMAELSAQEQLGDLRYWLLNIGIFGLIKWWFNQHKSKNKRL